MKRAVVFLTVVVYLTTVGNWRLVAAPPVQQEQNKCLISSPASGSQLRGQVVIAGSATHAGFTWYQLGYATEPNPSGEWKFFFSSETAVPGGRLGVWNTTLVPDGTYQLIMEVHRKDGNYDHCSAKQLRVNNTAPTPTFTAEPLPTPAETPTALATVPDTPTVAIEQPPAAGSRATPTYSPVDNPTPSPEMTGLKLPFDVSNIRNASCRGAQLAIVVSAVISLYFIIRNVMVSSVRKVWKSQDAEGFHARKPRRD